MNFATSYYPVSYPEGSLAESVS